MYITLLINKSRLGADTHQCADCVEHIDEKEGEYNYQHIKGQNVVKFKLAEYRSDGLWFRKNTYEFCHAQRDSYDHRDYYADKYCSGNVSGIEETGDYHTYESQKSRAGSKIPEGYQSSLIIDDDTCTFKSDECYEQSDTGTDGISETQRYGIDYGLTYIGALA